MATDAPPRESGALTFVALGLLGLLVVLGVVYLFLAAPLAPRVSSSVGAPEGFRYDAQCQADNRTCAFTITNDSTSTHTLTVRMTGATPAGATMTPATASLAPGASATITITYPIRACQAQITFTATYPQQPAHDMPYALPMPCATPGPHP